MEYVTPFSPLHTQFQTAKVQHRSSVNMAANPNPTTGGAKDHILLFPFMAKGHTIPLLHLAAHLSSSPHHLHVSVITTPANAPFLRSLLPPDSAVSLLLLPFPSSPALPSGVESTDLLPSLDLYPAFLAAASLLLGPFQDLLLSLTRSPSSPLCLVSDFFLGWTLPVCRRLGVPRLVFHGMSAFSMALCKSLWTLGPHLAAADDSDPFHVPGTPSRLLLTRREVPDTVRNSGDPDDPVTKFLAEIGDSDVSSWGVVVNSFMHVDKDYVELFESFYRKGARAWLVGPLCLLGGSGESAESDESGVLRWLDGRGTGSVVYVSFGTQTHVPDEQLDEVAAGLAESGAGFLWVVRSPKWAPPEGLLAGGRGKVVRWAPQWAVLRHRATGGFVSHCGWNSVLEAASAGVPVMAWPMIAEQHLNAKMVVEELGVGVGLRADENGVVGREEVTRGVRDLMGNGEEGRVRRERAEELGRRAREAVAEGGSSRQSLEELVEELRTCRSAQVSEGETAAAATVVDPVQVELHA